MNIQLVAAEKALTRKWLSEGWIDITTDLCKMENKTTFVSYKLEQFTSYW